MGLVEEWLLALDRSSYEQVVAALELLAERGPQLGRPLVDTVKASRHKNMKELRPGSSGRSSAAGAVCVRPRAKGDPAGCRQHGQWKSWYKVNIPIADDRFAAHLDELEGR